MKAAVVFEPGATPAYADFRDPEPQSGKAIIRPYVIGSGSSEPRAMVKLVGIMRIVYLDV